MGDHDLRWLMDARRFLKKGYVRIIQPHAMISLRCLEGDVYRYDKMLPGEKFGAERGEGGGMERMGNEWEVKKVVG